jgi:hypothetical protein
MPAINEPTPAERRELEERQNAEKFAQKEVAVARAVEDQKAKGGVFNKLNAMATTVAAQAEKAVTQTVTSAKKGGQALADEHATKRFQAAFPTLAGNEALLGDYSCKALNNGGAPSYTGYLQITDRHVCFVGDNRLNFFFPLTDILSIQKAVALPTEKNNLPFVLPIPHSTVIPTAMQIYTRQNHLHQFASFSNIADALNWLDHAWRAAANVPAGGPPPGYGQ